MPEQFGDEWPSHFSRVRAGGTGVVDGEGTGVAGAQAWPEKDHHVKGVFGLRLAEEEKVSGLGGFPSFGEEGGVVAHEVSGVCEVAGGIFVHSEQRGGSGGRLWQRWRCGQAPTGEPGGVVLAESLTVGEAGEGGAVPDLGWA
jgi:hypothetical protein